MSSVSSNATVLQTTNSKDQISVSSIQTTINTSSYNKCDELFFDDLTDKITKNPTHDDINNYANDFLKMSSDDIKFIWIAEQYLIELFISNWIPINYHGTLIFVNNKSNESSLTHQINNRCIVMYKLTKEKKYLEALEQNEKENLTLFFPLLL